MGFTTVKAPRILLPKKGVDMTSYAVIACDQFTSQQEYWDDLKKMIGVKPSTFHMIFPEAYLGKVDNDEYIKGINEHINRYLKDGVLTDIGPCFVLVERVTSYGVKRLGLIISIDLEDYSFRRGVACSIKASEATIEERIPPRLKIRRDAPVELPHTLVLFNDKEKTIIEPLYAKRDKLPLLYDFELNQNGGHLRGYQIKDTKSVIEGFEKLYRHNNNGLNFIVGDGNHSLATAKVFWDQLKEHLTPEERVNHPARYALVEANNIYDEGIVFEPIHKVVFNALPNFTKKLKDVCVGPCEDCYVYTPKDGKISLKTPQNKAETYQIVQSFIDDYLKDHPEASVDFIHDEDSLIKVAGGHKNAVAIKMPALGKSDIFAFVSRDAVLPRKSFSMGNASEKRYYLEAKSIRG